ncbi:siderophore-interacting protein [Curtobacterium sp. 18060]|uniref:siderophore-interacting protein n=1 Tax=Curtobacterium sp. 18060 TaxID=2681408 RepID=UPI001356A938|nr:siderophore-interacting protein [Curtobacterium sp. 18060]
MTDLEITTVMHPLRARTLEVLAVEDIGPRYRRLVLGGPDLEPDFPFPANAATDHVKVLVPDADGVVTVPEIRDDRVVRGEGVFPVARDYTVRAFDERGLVVDFVLHDHGLAGRWAGTARVGDRLGVLGPRGSHRYPQGYDRYLLVADETALPAVGRWLDAHATTPGDRSIDVVAVVQSVDEYPLPNVPGATVHWAVAPLGAGRADALAAAVRDRIAPGAFVWAAGESTQLKPLRRLLRERLERHQYDVDGYWRAGVVNLDHHESDDD